MSRKNGAKKDRQRSDRIRKAERKLAEALAEVDEARAKVARRERKLSTLLARHAPANGPVEEAVADREAATDDVETEAVLTTGATGQDTEGDIETESAVANDDGGQGESA